MKNNDYKHMSFKINYLKDTVTFSGNLFNKRKMSLKEFAITVLQIEPVSTEVIAMYIGKLGFDVYKDKDKFRIIFTKKIKNGVKGNIVLKENTR